MMYNKKFVAVIKCHGSILRESDGGTVHLPFGSTYTILLKNKHCRKAVVSVEVDGKDVLNGNKLIMEPNSSEELRGFMRNMRKTNLFKFINKTKKIQRYRGDRIDDGLIRIVYRFEKEPTDWIYIDNNPSHSFQMGAMRSYNSGSHDTVSCYSVSAPSYTKCSSTPRAEEGITVKGAKVRQDYAYGHVGELERSNHSIILHLKGQTNRRKRVVRPRTVRTKLSCEVCGKKSRSSAKYCSGCGNYLD